jgi:hypothetical protein
VSFHAREMTSYGGQADGSAVQFATVITNEGGGYNPTTSHFIVPVNGTYFFMASSVDPGSSPSRVNMALMVDDNTELDQVYTDQSNYGIPASVHGLVSLHQGQRVWVKALDSHTYFNGGNTAFRGFLIHS